MSHILCYEPFHLGAEFLTELPTTSSKLYPIRARRASEVVLGIMLDNTINRKIAVRHEIAAREYAARTFKSTPFFVYESDLAPIACALASTVQERYLNDRPKVLKIQPPWSASPIKLLSIASKSDLAVETLLRDPEKVIECDRCQEIIPTCSLYILAWNYFRAFSGERLTELAESSRDETRAFIKRSALALLGRTSNSAPLIANKVLSYLNRAYETPEERARIIGHFLKNEQMNAILSDRATIEVEFYSMFETDAMIEA